MTQCLLLVIMNIAILWKPIYLMICKVWTINYAGTTLEFFKSGVAAAMRISEIIEKYI